jgi:hypothetical protein
MPKEPIRNKPALKKTYGLRLDQALMKDLAHLAVDEEKWVNEMIEEAVRDLLKKYRDKRK